MSDTPLKKPLEDVLPYLRAPMYRKVPAAELFGDSRLKGFVYVADLPLVSLNAAG